MKHLKVVGFKGKDEAVKVTIGSAMQVFPGFIMRPCKDGDYNVVKSILRRMEDFYLLENTGLEDVKNKIVVLFYIAHPTDAMEEAFKELDIPAQIIYVDNDNALSAGKSIAKEIKKDVFSSNKRN